MWSYTTCTNACLLLLVAATSAQFVPCDICPQAKPFVGSPDVVVSTGDTEYTCAEAKELSTAGAFSAVECSFLRINGANLMCACRATEGTTDAPMEPPTMAPVVVVVAAPTDAPVVVVPVVTDSPIADPTEAPVNETTDPPIVAPTDPTDSPVEPPVEPPVDAPTESPVEATVETPVAAPVALTDFPVATPTIAPVVAAPDFLPTGPTAQSTTILVSLSNVTQALVNDTEAVFVDVCAEFLADKLDLVNVTCTIVDQTFQGAEGEPGPLDMEVLIEATADLDPTTFGALVIDTITMNFEEFVELLKDALEDFFMNLETVDASEPPIDPASVDEDSDGGLSTGSVIGIVIGAILGISALAIILNGCCNQETSRSVAPVVVHTQPLPDGMDNPADSVQGTKRALPVVATGTSVAMGSADRTGPGESVVSYAYSMEGTSTAAPSTVASGGAAGAGGAALLATSKSKDEESLAASHAMSSLRSDMASRIVIAPPGKLGIVIDTSLEGPVVHKIKPGGPMEGELFPGDIIIKVDETDTRAMSATAITALMVRTSNFKRKLIVLSEDVVN